MPEKTVTIGENSFQLDLPCLVLATQNPVDQEGTYSLPEDIKEAAKDVLNHRIILNYEAEADGISTEHIVEKLLKKIPINH